LFFLSHGKLNNSLEIGWWRLRTAIWRNYVVKRTSDSAEVVNKFISHHKIEVVILCVVNEYKY